jgi:hypothetical protein
MQLHPILYVADQYAERSFYELFGFACVYEGEEFPGFLAIRRGEAVFGLQRASPEQPAYARGLRWQFELETAGQVDEIIATCRGHGLEHEVATERGGDRFLTRLVSVTSPAGITVWFEGPNEAGHAGTQAETLLTGSRLEVGELPGAVEGGAVRAVDTEVDEPADAGQGLDPGAVGHIAGRWLGPEVEPGRLIGGRTGEFEH